MAEGRRRCGSTPSPFRNIPYPPSGIRFWIELMSGVKEIRIKIASFKSTQKITKAMEMVAASKMRKAQERMRATRPYAEKIRKVIGHLRHANPDYKHPFMVERPAKSV